MGLGNNTGRLTYVNIKKGELAVKVDGEIKLFGNLSGHLTDIAIGDDEYQGKKFKVLLLTINDGDDNFLLKMRLESGYATAFCMAIQNANLAEPITFIPSFKVENDKNKAALFLNQHGKSLKWFYTKADPKDLPGLKKAEFKGQILWDNTEQVEFLVNMLLSVIKPALVHPLMAGNRSAAASPNPPVDHPLADRSNPAAGITEPIDDLPF